MGMFKSVSYTIGDLIAKVLKSSLDVEKESGVKNEEIIYFRIIYLKVY